MTPDLPALPSGPETAVSASGGTTLPSRIDPANPFVRQIGDATVRGVRPRTLEVLESGWRDWKAACDAAGVPYLPCDAGVLLHELRRRINAGHKRATIETLLLFPIRKASKRLGYPDPTKDDAFLDVWRQLCAEHLTERQEQAVPLSEEHLEALFSTLDPERPRDCLMAAIAGAAYDGMLRISELVAMEHRHLEPVRDGGLTLLIPRSKTDATGKGAEVYLRPEVAEWINRHRRIQAERAPEGPWVFASPYRGGRDPITTRHAANLLHEAGLRIGVEGLSGHSGRVGAAQDMAVSGATLPMMQHQGRWKTSAMPARYASRADAVTTAKARFEIIKKSKGHP